MTSHQQNALTHWCRNCDTHHALQHVRHCLPASNTPSDEVEVLICPHCASYDVETLQEIDDEQ